MPPKSSLGRGLGAMFPDLLKDLNDKPAFLMCGIEELSPNRFQPRKDFNDQDQKQLVASIRKSGIIQPIIVRKSDSGYEIIAGERRWRAAQQAGLSSVPVIIRDAQDLDLAELSLIENIQREALNPVEEAEAYQTLTGTFNLSQEELASRVGKDRSTIANAIRLLQLPAAVKTALIEKKITTGHARPLLSLASPREQIDALEIILKKGLTVRETERLIQDARKDMPERKKTKPDPYIADLEKTLSRHLMTRVQISSLHKERGTIEIRFNSEEDLNRLFRILMGDQ
ncbi:MAG: putative chromosome-partitioning protein ParB [Syntrophaceae bacterium PtaB.Bin095]|jgi:ParB family chromosome partitioning protein|nr:MAG: putative chromosome-partitioning protein ParB [Syntrophaceae bacterium PtaB.Bin095]